jgi:hypothetical protein
MQMPGSVGGESKFQLPHPAQNDQGKVSKFDPLRLADSSEIKHLDEQLRALDCSVL